MIIFIEEDNVTLHDGLQKSHQEQLLNKKQLKRENLSHH